MKEQKLLIIGDLLIDIFREVEVRKIRKARIGTIRRSGISCFIMRYDFHRLEASFFLEQMPLRIKLKTVYK